MDKQEQDTFNPVRSSLEIMDADGQSLTHDKKQATPAGNDAPSAKSPSMASTQRNLPGTKDEVNEHSPFQDQLQAGLSEQVLTHILPEAHTSAPSVV